MNAQEQTITRFYAAFAALDPDGMQSCYAPGVEFRDEVFTLHGRDETMAMWRMLCEAVRAKGMAEWKLVASAIGADGAQGSAHWDATYRFSATGRMVNNSIDATMRFDGDGLIVEHHDRFDFWRWSRQALGAPGMLLGWTPLLRGKVRERAARNLQQYRQRQAAQA